MCIIAVQYLKKSLYFYGYFQILRPNEVRIRRGGVVVRRTAFFLGKMTGWEGTVIVVIYGRGE